MLSQGECGRAPEVLTLHLKRFQQDLSGSLRKINGPVPFPQELDLSPFCAAEVRREPSFSSD